MADACRFQKNILRDAVRFCQCGVVVFLPSGVYFQYVPIANHIQRYLKACPFVIPHRSKETIGSTTTKKKTGNKRNKRQSIVFHREREREREREMETKQKRGNLGGISNQFGVRCTTQRCRVSIGSIGVN